MKCFLEASRRSKPEAEARNPIRFTVGLFFRSSTFGLLSAFGDSAFGSGYGAHFCYKLESTSSRPKDGTPNRSLGQNRRDERQPELPVGRIGRKTLHPDGKPGSRAPCDRVSNIPENGRNGRRGIHNKHSSLLWPRRSVPEHFGLPPRPWPRLCRLDDLETRLWPRT